MGEFDGLICFGGSDWWYHNRGHYDMQMCRQFASHVPVLYINSLGVRTPGLGEGAMFFRRVSRKIRSWSRGFVLLHKHFGVVSPISIPSRLGRVMGNRLVRQQVRTATKHMGILSPLVWVECPTAGDLALAMPKAGLVYQRTDRYEEFPGVDRQHIQSIDRTLKSEADITLFCSRYLFAQEEQVCRRAQLIDHGVDFDLFRNAGIARREPQDLQVIPRPRIGFVGGIDEHTFDAALFCAVVHRQPEWEFVMVGQCSFRAGWCPYENVHLLGQRPYEQVADYMAACDVLIMPWNDNEWVRACNPVKLKEYLAVGRPVVSTRFDELDRYEKLVSVAKGPDEFVAAIQVCLKDPGDAGARQRFVQHETWQSKGEKVLSSLSELMLRPAKNATDSALETVSLGHGQTSQVR